MLVCDRSSSTCGKELSIVGCIVVVGALTRCALLLSMCDLKVRQMNRNVCCEKGEDTLDQNSLTRWLKKFISVDKNFDEQANSGKP